jgi:hypothetical protein
MKAIHPQASVREYWLSKRDDVNHVVRLLWNNGDYVNTEEYIEKQDGELETVSEYQ